MKRTSLLVALLLLAGCASGPTPRDLIQLTYYRVTRKVLVFVPSPCGAAGSGNPYLVSAWVREKDLKRTVIVCKPDCTDCQIRVKVRGTRGTGSR